MQATNIYLHPRQAQTAHLRARAIRWAENHQRGQWLHVDGKLQLFVRSAQQGAAA